MHTADHITLAVFPFEDLSLQKDLNIFCRSFSADLKTELSKFRQFGVISYPNHALSSDTSFTSFFDELKTDYFIQGNFRCDKDVVRINVQLYNTHTQQLVWGNRLEGKLNNLDEIHENVLIGVVGILQQQINYDLLSRIRKRPKVEFKAYEHWLYGVEELKKGSVENDLKARQNFQKSIEIQPDYSLAYSGMSLPILTNGAASFGIGGIFVNPVLMNGLRKQLNLTIKIILPQWFLEKYFYMMVLMRPQSTT